jgi:Putative heavy-metal-binding
MAPPQANWRELLVSELIRKAEVIDADAIIGLDYETDSIVPIERTGLQIKRILATGVAVKLSCAAYRMDFEEVQHFWSRLYIVANG